MVKSVEEPKKEDNKNLLNLENSLIISIDQNEKIIKFNEFCEEISGYRKDEVINKQFFDFLIPTRYLNKWKNMLNSIRKDMLIDDFKLPLLTRDGHEIMISWSSYPLKNFNGVIGDVGLVGKPVASWNEVNEPIDYYSMNDMEKTENYIDVEKTIKALEIRNFELENKNKKLEKDLEKLRARRSHIWKKEDKHGKSTGSILGRWLYYIFDLVGGKKKMEELERMMEELEERRILLEGLEDQIDIDKKDINEQKNEFCQWREKLELLEEEIEKRHKELSYKEKQFKKALQSCIDKDISPVSSEELAKETIDQPEFLNKLSDCAVIIQRGILKQVNNSFVDLTGYNVDEIVDKSLFDFIVPEGFSEIEKYYLNRLKGEDVSVYETIFLTKDNKKISVEISTKPTFFHGEKAEIAIIKKLEVNKD